MSKYKINCSVYERCLLTDVAPYETPLIYSNWGSYNYFKNLVNNNPPQLVKLIMENSNKCTISFNFQYYKNKINKRTLSLIHPGCSQKIINLYSNFETLIINLCKKSNYSIRYPHSIAKLFLKNSGTKNKIKEIQQFTEDTVYASSYYSYMHFSHLYKYFESNEFTDIEKRFLYQKHLDISKCFPSIYTHSISWAIRGKADSKSLKNNDKSFGTLFDNLMQSINFKETNGIIIGPEISRIFAEIILQEIDRKVELKMEQRGKIHSKDYHCARYIDDYHVYFNDSQVEQLFREILSDELEKFKLYLNSEKTEITNRPFISKISIKKLAISNYINNLADNISNGKNIKIQKEINRIREIFNSNPEENHALTNFFISVIIKRINLIYNLENEKYKLKIIKLFIDIVFYLINMDTRVSSIYKLATFICKILSIINKLPKYNQLTFLDQIYYEICEILEKSLKSNAYIELMNLLILLTELDKKYLLDKNIIKKIIESCQNKNILKENNITSLNYFEIVTLLFYIKDIPEYEEIRQTILEDTHKIIEATSVLKHSETAHIFVDLIACPFLNKPDKQKIIEVTIKNIDNIRKDECEINRIINFISKGNWYTNWNTSTNLKKMLKKKEYMLSY